MGSLGLAGIISGFGNGAGRGLEQMQSGIIQQGLQSSDREWQMRKLQEQRVWDAKALGDERTYQSGEKQKDRESTRAIHEGDRNANLQLHEGDRTARTADTKMQIDANKELQGDKIGYETGKDKAEQGLKGRQLANEENKTKIEERLANARAEYYKAVAGLKDRSPATGAKGNVGIGKVMDLNRVMIQENIKLRALATPEQMKGIDREIKELRRHSLQIGGVEQPTPTTIIDPDDDGAEGGQ